MIHGSLVTKLWHDLRSEYDRGKIDIEQLTYGQGTLYRLMREAFTEPYAKLWLEEQQRQIEETPK